MKAIYLTLTFITSFATMSYAMITASIISDFTGEEILSQCLTMGPYLLGLGLGSIFGDRIDVKNSVKFLWRMEWMSVLFLPLIPLVHIGFIFFYIHLSGIGTSLESKESLRYILALASVMSFGTGLLGGSQLPLIIRMIQDKVKAEIVLAVNYAGPLLAGPFIVFCNHLSLPASVQIGIVGLIQIVGLCLLMTFSPSRLFRMVLLSLPLLILIGVSKIYPRLEYLTVKASYIGTKMFQPDLKELRTVLNTIESYGQLERVRTPYQVIDFYTAQAHPEMQSPANATLYLNRKTQFDLYAVDVYHQSMVHAGLNLQTSSPKNVLVLGAGDGLILKELKSVPGIQKITMVELDDGIIQWASEHPVISRLNDNVFDKPDPRIQLIVADAITFLRRHSADVKYDLIFIDFPFPNGHELAKLYSQEFYSLVKKVTTPDSLVVIDLPVQREADGILTLESQVILKTLKVSGFSNQLPFGPVASFIAVKRSGRQLAFNYSTLSKDISLATRLNLVQMVEAEEVAQTEASIPVNSMFWPRGL